MQNEKSLHGVQACKYTTGDIVSLTVKFKSLRLSYTIIKKNQTEEKKEIFIVASRRNCGGL